MNQQCSTYKPRVVVPVSGTMILEMIPGIGRKREYRKACGGARHRTAPGGAALLS